MENQAFKDIIKTNTEAKLSNNEDYYNNVFKKTERIVSALLYVLSFVDSSQRQSSPYTRLENCLFKTHDAVLDSLTIKETQATQTLFTLQHTLLALESNLRLATATRLIPGEVVPSIEDELDSVMRFIRNHYMVNAGSGVVLKSPARSTESNTLVQSNINKPRRLRPNIPANDLSSDAVLVYSDLNDRSVRIKTVLDATPNATIKDLSEVITDVSSKTIQRELNSLIEKGEVKRDGERRWSTYTLIN